MAGPENSLTDYGDSILIPILVKYTVPVTPVANPYKIFLGHDDTATTYAYIHALYQMDEFMGNARWMNTQRQKYLGSLETFL